MPLVKISKIVKKRKKDTLTKASKSQRSKSQKSDSRLHKKTVKP